MTRMEMHQMPAIRRFAAFMAVALSVASAPGAEWIFNEFALRALARTEPAGGGGFVCPVYGLSSALGTLGYAMPPESRPPFSKELSLFSGFPESFAEVRGKLLASRAFIDNNGRSCFVLWALRGMDVRGTDDGVDTGFAFSVQDSFGGEVVRTMYPSHANRLISVMTDGEFPCFLAKGEELGRAGCSYTGACSMRPRFEKPFDPAATAAGRFRSPGGSSGVRFVRGEQDGAAGETGGFSAAALRMKGGLVLVLVKPRDPAAKLPQFKDLTPSGLAEIFKCLAVSPEERVISSLSDDALLEFRTNDLVRVSLPVFSQTRSIDLAEYFASAGLPRSGFSSLGSGAGVGFMRIETKFAIDEGGMPPDGEIVSGDPAETSLAARKDAVAKASPAKAPERRRTDRNAKAARKPVDFACDVPFMYFVCHEKTGCIVFAGRYAGETPPAK